MTPDAGRPAARRIGGLHANEVRLFGFVAAYGFLIAAVYWFVSYDITGTVMLGGFGLATGAGFALLWNGTRHVTVDVGSPAGDAMPAGDVASPEPAAVPEVEGPLGDASGPIPVRSVAPLWIGLGLAVASLALVYGIWFAIAGLLPIALGAADWLAAAGREIRLLHSPPHGDDREE